MSSPGRAAAASRSLAFDTIYAEGQRRYVETFSPYTRQFLDRMDKPKVDAIRGIPPAIAIEQSNHVKSTRSTVGTITEINDYLKILMPRLAKARCPDCAREIRPETARSIAAQMLESVKPSKKKNGEPPRCSSPSACRSRRKRSRRISSISFARRATCASG